MELSPPFNWCDRRCERCPLNSDCPVGSVELDPDESPIEHAFRCFADAMRMLTEIAEREGISLDDLPPPPPLSLDSHLLREAVEQLTSSLGYDVQAMVIAAKIARLGLADSDDGPDIWDFDTVPNLLLIERLLDELEPSEPLHRLRLLLAPLMQAIPTEARTVLAVLERAGRAPSPFLRQR